MADDDLTKRIQSLPAELFNNILDYALTPDESSVTIDKAYKPPSQLQLNRATRTAFAKAYYTSTTFQIPRYGPALFAIYTLSLDPSHSLLISTIRLVSDTKIPRIFSSELTACYEMWTTGNWLRYNGVRVHYNAVLEMEIRIRERKMLARSKFGKEDMRSYECRVLDE